jgi:hypothetical protein
MIKTVFLVSDLQDDINIKVTTTKQSLKDGEKYVECKYYSKEWPGSIIYLLVKDCSAGPKSEQPVGAFSSIEDMRKCSRLFCEPGLYVLYKSKTHSTEYYSNW